MANYNGYKEGDTSDLGCIIKRIISINSNIAVYFSDGNSIAYEFSEDRVLSEYGLVKSEFDRLIKLIPINAPDSMIRQLKHELGTSLFHALSSSNIEDALSFFDNVSSKINKLKTPEQAKITFVAYSISLSTIAISALIYLSFALHNMSDIVLCMLFGVVGALLSTLQRNISFDIDLLASYWMYFAHAFIKILTGIISGLVIFLISHSGIALSFAKDNTYALLLFCLISGFSERYIPDLLAKIKDRED